MIATIMYGEKINFQFLFEVSDPIGFNDIQNDYYRDNTKYLLIQFLFELNSL